MLSNGLGPFTNRLEEGDQCRQYRRMVAMAKAGISCPWTNAPKCVSQDEIQGIAVTDVTKKLIDRINELENQLEAEFERRSADFRYRIEKRRVIFEDEMVRRHKVLKQRLWTYVRGARPLVVVTAPVIYSIIVPLLLLDVFVSIYQAVCFPVYGIAKVRRGDHIIFDRHHLAYLNGLEKLNCIYCSYANGLISFVREVAARTERYWCPIKHARRLAAAPHSLYHDFAEYGDADRYRKLTGTKDE